MIKELTTKEIAVCRGGHRIATSGCGDGPFMAVAAGFLAYYVCLISMPLATYTNVGVVIAIILATGVATCYNYYGTINVIEPDEGYG